MSNPSQGITITVNAQTAEAANAIKEFFSKVNSGMNELTKAGEFLNGLGTKLAAAFTIEKIVEQFKKAIDGLEDMEHATRKTGLALNQLGAVRKVGMQLGEPFDEAVRSISFFNQKIGEAIRMGGEAARPFRDLKVALLDMNGVERNSGVILEETLKAWKQLPSVADQGYKATVLFGRGGREAIPFLTKLADALEDVKGKPGLFQEKDVENAVAFNTTLREVNASLARLFRQIAADVLPMLIEFAQWVKTLTANQAAMKTITDSVHIAFQLLAMAVLYVREAFIFWQDVLSSLMAGGLAVLENEITLLIDLFKEWWMWIKNIASSMLDLVKSVRDYATVMKDFATGNFKKAGEEAKALLDRWNGDLKNMGGATVTMLKAQGATAKKFFVESAADVRTAFNGVGEKIISDAMKFMSAVRALWSGKSGEGAAAGGAGGAATGSKTGGNQPADISEAGKKMVEEIEKAYAEATQSKVRQMENQRDLELAKLKEELGDYVLYAEKKLLVETAWAAKIMAVKRKEAEEQIQIAASQNQAQQKALESDPTKTDLQKQKQLIPLLQQELAIEQKSVDLQKAILADPHANDEAKLAATKELVKLDETRLDVARKLKVAENMQTWGGQIRMRIDQLKAQFGDFKKTVVDGTFNLITQSVQGLANALTSVIMGSKSAGQAFAEFGTQILTNFIATILEAILWAEVAIPILTALGVLSGGSTAGAGAGITIAAVGVGVAGVNSTIGRHEKGGPVFGGPQLSWLNEAGREYVFSAPAVANLGTDYLDNLHAMAKSGYMAAAPGAGRSGRGGPAGGGGGGVNVQGHKMSVAIVNSKQQLKEFLQSAEGKAIVVSHVKNSKVQIGLQT